MSVAALGLTQGANWLHFFANTLKLWHTIGPSDCVKIQVKVSFSAEEKLGVWSEKRWSFLQCLSSLFAPPAWPIPLAGSWHWVMQQAVLQKKKQNVAVSNAIARLTALSQFVSWLQHWKEFIYLVNISFKKKKERKSKLTRLESLG